MQARRVCPRCGLGIHRNVVIDDKNGLGPSFYCGTTFDPKLNKVVKEGIACRVIQDLRKELKEVTSERE